MNMQEFQQKQREAQENGENYVIDPNLARAMADQNKDRVTPPDKEQILKEFGGQTQPKAQKKIVDPSQIHGIEIEKEEEKIDHKEEYLSDIDKAIARKQREAIVMGEAIEESMDAGEPLTDEEFADILEQRKDFINGEDSESPDTPIEHKKVEESQLEGMITGEEGNSLEDELAREAAELENDEEADDGIMEEEEYYEEEREIAQEHREIPKTPEAVEEKKEEKVSRSDQVSYEDASKMFSQMSEEYDSGDIDFERELEDLDNNSDVSDAERIAKERTDKLAALIREKIKPVTDKLDISTFSIVSKPAPNKIDTPRASKNDIADWVLMSSKRPIYMKKFTGSDIERLSNGGKGRTRFNKAMDLWTLIYKHIVDPYKPQTVEEWAKVTSFLDIEHIYMAIYRANFDGANYIPYNCRECNEVILTDNVDIMEMCKFENPEARKTFDSIIGSECTPEHSQLYASEVVPISDTYAFAFREPSIYNIVFESAVLDEEFINKFGDMVSFASYIDKIYYIDQENRQLRPINTSIFRNNMQKTVRARIIKYAQIMSSLNSDQYNTLLAYMQYINKGGESLTYQLPEISCPKCKTKIDAMPQDSAQLVFTRHQLAALATS